MGFSLCFLLSGFFPGGSEVKASACNAGDLGSIPGSVRSPGEGNGNPLQYLAWKIPWTEEPGGLQSMGSQRVRLHVHAHTVLKEQALTSIRFLNNWQNKLE